MKYGWIGALCWRFLSGNHLDGMPRTNASWTMRGSIPRHKANWWNRMARLERLAWRHGIVIFLAAQLAAFLTVRLLAELVDFWLAMRMAEFALRRTHWHMPQLRVSRTRGNIAVSDNMGHLSAHEERMIIDDIAITEDPEGDSSNVRPLFGEEENGEEAL